MSNRTTPSPATQPAQAGKSSMTSNQGHGHHAAIPHDKIAMRAYEKWCKRGRPQGSDQQDWLDAERELRAEMGGQSHGMSGHSHPQSTPTRR